MFAVGMINHSHVKLIKHYWVHTIQELMDFYYHVISQGHEGIVIYDPTSMYTNGKSYAWMRLIPEPTADCECIGFYEGTKGLAHEGSLGGIYVDFNGIKCKVGTGFKSVFEGNEPETVRQYIWDNQDKFLGVIAECAYKDKTPNKKMRQPRFKAWRWDKV
jgi:ATP-dependent DNA ligase